MSFADLATSACYSYLAHSHYVIPCVSALYSYHARDGRHHIVRWGMPHYAHVCWVWVFAFPCVCVCACVYLGENSLHVSHIFVPIWLHIYTSITCRLLSSNGATHYFLFSFSIVRIVSHRLINLSHNSPYPRHRCHTVVMRWFVYRANDITNEIVECKCDVCVCGWYQQKTGWRATNSMANTKQSKPNHSQIE